jgi:hypothetical protein
VLDGRHHRLLGMDGQAESWTSDILSEALAGALKEAEAEFIKTVGMDPKEAVIGKEAAS